jgi:hypothetical protein
MMRKRWNAGLFMALVITGAGAGALAWAQDQPILKNDSGTDGANAATDEATLVAAGKPFTARISIDSHTPVAYGDDVIISVWITPREDLDLQYVRLHPKGELTDIYKSQDLVPSTDANEAPTQVSGANCRVSSQGHPKGEPFVAICQLTNLRTGWLRWTDWNTLVDSGRQQVEVEIGLQNGVDATAVYYEFATLDFVSPKVAVVLGGFFGAFLYTLIALCMVPVGDPPLIKGWRDMIRRSWAQLPQTLLSLLYFLWRVARSSLLGGVTAMVLIILAKSSEGFEPPISLHIQDFWGGLLIGLLSVHLSKWVKDKLDTLIP